MAGSAFTKARSEENNEYYTRYEDIQTELNAYLEYNPNVFKNKVVLLPCDDPEWSNFTRFFAQNFEHLGIKKLISTSYATDSKNAVATSGYQFTFDDFLTDFEKNSSQYDETKTSSHGKIFVLERDTNTKTIDIDNLKWSYLTGDGDFRSDEVKALRNEADIVVTNPPFSLFRDFIAWIREANKDFIVLGNPNLLSKKELFPLFQHNEIWCGKKPMSEDSYFIIPENYKERLIKENKEGSGYKTIDGVVYGRSQAMWYTNIEHGRRHEPMQLMTKEDNLRYTKHKNNKKWEFAYIQYENYTAIEVPFIDSIPKDYSGIMGVPITFMGQYCPEQFEIIGRTADINWCKDECSFFTPCDEAEQKRLKKLDKTWRIQNAYTLLEDNAPKTFYDRIFIRFTDSWIASHPEDFSKGV